jgi:hypothetical protein
MAANRASRASEEDIVDGARSGREQTMSAIVEARGEREQDSTESC